MDEYRANIDFLIVIGKLAFYDSFIRKVAPSFLSFIIFRCTDRKDARISKVFIERKEGKELIETRPFGVSDRE